MMDSKTIKMIEDETLEFVRVNMNHLPMYYIPGEEFPWLNDLKWVLIS